MNNCMTMINGKAMNFTCAFGRQSNKTPAAVWVCGDRANHTLPKGGWSGCCYHALIDVGKCVYLPGNSGLNR